MRKRGRPQSVQAHQSLLLGKTLFSSSLYKGEITYRLLLASAFLQIHCLPLDAKPAQDLLDMVGYGREMPLVGIEGNHAMRQGLHQ